MSSSLVKNAFLFLHHDLHAKAHDTELGTALTPDHLRQQLLKLNPDCVQCDCKGHEGYASYPTQVGSASPGIVRDALRIYRDVTSELGLPLLVHYSGIWDQRALELHPSWAAIDATGKPVHETSGAPAAVCPRSPYLRELMIPQFIEIIDQYDVDGFWVDGDNWAMRDCYCERCVTEYAKRTERRKPPESKSDADWGEWRKFQQESLVEFVTTYADAVHARNPDCIVCSNWLYSMRQPGKIAAPIDILSGDFMASFGCERAEMEGRYIDGHGVPWNLMSWSFCTTEHPRIAYQTKTAEHLKQEAAEVLSCGGGYCIYDLPQRSGRLNEWHYDLFAEVAAFCRDRQPFCQGTRSLPDAVVLQGDAHALRHNPEPFCMGESFYPAEGALHALIENHYHVDILDEQRLMERIDGYGLVVIAGQDPVCPELLDAVETYAQRGGTVLLTGPHLAEMCGQLVGVESAGEARCEAWHVPVGDEVATLSGAWRPVVPTDSISAVPLLNNQQPDRDDSGYPAATVRSVGKGKIVAVHGEVMWSYYFTHHPRIRRFIHDLLESAAVQRHVRLDAPASIEVSLRERAGSLFVHLVNRGASPTLTPRLHMVEEVPVVSSIVVKIRLDAPPSQVLLEPGHESVKWSFAEDWLTVHVEKLHIHSIVAIKM